MPKFASHIFVCTNQRPLQGRPSCAARGSLDVCRQLARAVATDASLVGRVGVTESGCLGPCFDGPNLVIYPEGVWYAGVAAGDVELIVESHLRRGIVVQRLRHDWVDEDE